MKHFLARSVGLTLAIFAALCPAHAQMQAGPSGAPAVVALTVHSLTPAVYWVEGGGGNTGFIVGKQDVIVVDTTISEDGARALLAEISKVTSKPVTTVILTHSDGDHVNGLGVFPAGVTIIAHPATKARMEASLAAGRSRVPADRLPNHTVAAREVLIRDGIRLEVLHWTPAHTDGDLVAYLPEQKIVFTGDIFSTTQPRALIHSQQQGNSAGWVTAAKAIVALDADRYVLGHGEMQHKADLQARTKLVEDERTKIKALVAQGKPLAQIQAEVGDPPASQGAAVPQRFPPFSAVVYQELTGVGGAAGSR